MRVCPVCRQQFPAGANFCPHDGHRLEDLDETAAAHDPFVGQVLDERYKVEARLGAGGMGHVYAARHVVIDKPVAVKILRKAYSRDPRQAERFIREARAASLIGHPNIIDVTDFGRLDNGQIYFVMEFLVGATLGNELRSQGALTTRRALNLAIQICHALEAAHAKGIVHRDLKPENIFIVNPVTRAAENDAGGRHQDVIKLLDFGIAKITWDAQGRRLTKAGSIFGTPQYMSPEQASGSDTDFRGDIYSLGCIIYEMLTGEVPFIADTFMGTLTKQMFENPVPPRQLRPDLHIPEPLEATILKAMSKDAAERQQSMRELAAALESCYQLSEAGPVRRAAPEVILVQPGASLKDLAGGDRETVHLLTPKPQQGEAPTSTTWPRVPWRLLGIVGVALVVGGGATFLALRVKRPAPVAARMAADTGTPQAPDQRVVVAQAPADAGSRVQLELRTVPPGAMVVVDGQASGLTPRTVTVTRDTRHRFVFRLRGYRQEVMEQRVTRDGTLVVRMTRQHRSGGGSRRGPVRTPHGSTEDLRNPFNKLDKRSP